MTQTRRTTLKAVGAAAALALAAGTAFAQAPSFFRIATGGTSGTYFPIGGLIANAISAPPGSRACDEGGACGAPGLIATAMSSNGSVANVNGIAGGTIESGFSQSDVAYWAYTGTGIWEDQEAVEGLRAIANLYPESIHLAGLRRQRHRHRLRPRGQARLADEPGSGTLVDAHHPRRGGPERGRHRAEYLKPGQAADRMRDGAMDAFFFVGGFPAGAIAELASQDEIVIVPIDGDVASGSWASSSSSRRTRSPRAPTRARMPT